MLQFCDEINVGNTCSALLIDVVDITVYIQASQALANRHIYCKCIRSKCTNFLPVYFDLDTHLKLQ